MRAPALFVAAVAWIAILAAMPHARGGEAGVPTLDQEIERSWRAAGVEPAPLSGDHEFLRRVTLDLTGRVPRVGEVEAFVADTSADRRARVVDRLLASDDYAARWADVYLDVLIGREARFRPRLAAPSERYFEDAFRRNKPMDQLAAELIAATGQLADNGAVSFVAAHRIGGGSIENLAGKTARVFLGAQIQCAQCHDHPYDDTVKQEDFRRFAAYFAAARPRQVRDPVGGNTIAVIEDARLPYAPPPRMVARRKARLPYVVEPRFFGARTPPEQGENRRQVLARTVVGSPAFARVTVNRTWSELFGRPLVAPWDDLSAGDSPILDRLAREFAAHGFDHRWLLRSIVLSTAYQRSSRGGKAAEPDAVERTFARASVRPLSAGQLFAAQLAATGVEDADRGLKRWKVHRHVERAKRQYLFAFADDEGEGVDSFSGNVPQALLLRNGPVTNTGVRAAPGTVLGRILAATQEPGQRLEWMFLATLTRLPTATERAAFLAHARAAGPAGYEDIFHALITSTEFGTNH